MSSAQKDLYSVLGVLDSAEFAVIRAAYKTLIMIYHPDKYPGDKNQAVKMSKDINEAYAVLMDPDKRKKYDAQRVVVSGKNQTQPQRQPDQKGASAIRELKRTLQESEAILQILETPDKSFNPFSELHEFKSLVLEAESILNLLNELN